MHSKMKKNEKIIKMLGERFGDDPKAVQAIHTTIEAKYRNKTAKNEEKMAREAAAFRQEVLGALGELSKSMAALDIKGEVAKSTASILKAHNELNEKVTGQGKWISDTTESMSKNNDIYSKDKSGLKKFMEKIERQLDKMRDKGNPTMAMGAPNRSIYLGGTIASGRYSDLNYIAGTGLTITEVDNEQTQHADITFATTGGGGFSTLAATEIPNGNIKVFTFSTATAQPSYLILDGVWTRAVAADSTVNWTWNSGTKQASVNVPPNDDIIGVV